MDFISLGNCAHYPKVGGACSSLIFRNGATKILIDLGAGTISRLLKVQNPCDLQAIFISKWSADHCLDIFALASYYAENLEEGKRIKLYCPKEESALYLQQAMLLLCFEIVFLEDGQVLNIGALNVQVIMQEFGQLSASFVLYYGLKKLVYTGDVGNIERLFTIANKADVLICDACYPHAQWEPNFNHLSAMQAGELGRQVDAKLVLLSNLSPKINEELIFYESFAAYPKCQLLKTEHLYQI